jgi:fumarate reductase subunit D
MTKLASLLLLGVVFAIGAFTADGPAINAGTHAHSVIATLAVIVLMGFGVAGWSRIVRVAHQAELASQSSSRKFARVRTLAQVHSEPTA